MEDQRNFMMKFGGKAICVDSTHNTCRYDVKLVTVLVLGPHDEGLPVAFLITTKETIQVLSLFFAAIRRLVGEVRAQFFMTDDYSAYHCASGIPTERGRLGSSNFFNQHEQHLTQA